MELLVVAFEREISDDARTDTRRFWAREEQGCAC